MPKGLIESPLDFIFAEHHRQRAAAAMLSVIAEGAFDADGVRDLIGFLTTDFALHIGDEEIVLFPALRDHCRPNDDVGDVIDRLLDEHREDETGAEAVVALLRRRLVGMTLSREESRRLTAFADHVRRHLALENAVLLPIARLRFNDGALKSISDSLKRRRGR
jgi:hemerythrin-like domain-containing protein